MKFAELRDLSAQELEQKINDTRKELFGDRFKHSLQQLENTAAMRQKKRQIAQMMTALQQKQAK